MKLAHFAGKQIALVIEVRGNQVVLRGTSSLRHDENLGSMLRVKVNPDDDAAVGSPVFLISEEQWVSNIAADRAHGCDYRLNLSRTEASVS